MSFQDCVQNFKPPKQKETTQQAYSTDPIDIAQLLNEENEELLRHEFWQEMDDVSPGERKVIEHQINNIIKQTINRVKHKYENYGNLPAGLKTRLDQIMEQMQTAFNWRRILRLFASSSTSSYLKNTIRRPSKRYGTSPGIKVKRRHRLLLAIDTSKSIQQKELAEFFLEINHIWRQGATVFILEFDTLIQRKYKYQGKTPKDIKGSGGTDFNAPIRFANEEFRPDAIIYFTDGFAEIPEITSRSPILWVISSQGMSSQNPRWDKLPGKVIKIAT